MYRYPTPVARVEPDVSSKVTLSQGPLAKLAAPNGTTAFQTPPLELAVMSAWSTLSMCSVE